jgi:hypothetical protein
LVYKTVVTGVEATNREVEICQTILLQNSIGSFVKAKLRRAALLRAWRRDISWIQIDFLACF